MVLATGCGILSNQLGDREGYSAVYDDNEYEAIYDGDITAMSYAQGECGSNSYPRLANVEGSRDDSDWAQCLCWRFHFKANLQCFAV